MDGTRPYTFAKKIGVEKGLFQYYWQKGGMPTAENLVKIQAGTGCSIDWLLTGRVPTIEGNLANIRFEARSLKEAGARIAFVNSVRKLKEIYDRQSKEKITALESVLDLFSQ
ncbi:MAG: hypothetical protein HY280_00180 [Nitrospinae bacterium]|nr:hypothetical protein [Nitrospinota bacterium]